jgi:hypothetical protein
LGEEYLQGMAAAVDVKRGNGHIVLIGFRPQWRGQTFGTFKVLFNAVMYGEGVAGAVPDSSSFWVPLEELDEDEEGQQPGNSQRP